MMRVLVFSVALVAASGLAGRAGSAQPAERQNVVLITLDGARTEEIFGGLDLAVLQSTLREKERAEDKPAYKRFWAATPQLRRERLMPFFWKTLMSGHGSIAGNREAGSIVRLTNTHRFSYPGYSEILTGEAHDDVIDSNDSKRNPYPTVLEGLRAHLGVPPGGVATFGSWDVFTFIVEHTQGATFVNAGFAPFASTDPAVRLMSDLQRLAPTAWDTVRHDYYTHRFAMTYLAQQRPRVLYLAYGETDDWAHDGRYDRVLTAYAEFDEHLRELWTWLESQDDYRGRTHLVISTDHGRGHTPADWRNHGAKVEGAQDTWIAFASPRLTRRGEWHDHPPLATNQIAATLARWMGLDWVARHPQAGKPIE